MTFDPTSISGLQVWYDCAAITGKSDGDTVHTWSDLSGNSRDATDSGNTQTGPTYKTNIINGNPVLRFTTSQRLDIASFATWPSKRGSLFMVAGNYTSAVSGGGTYGDVFGTYNGGSPTGPYWIREVAISGASNYAFYDNSTDLIDTSESAETTAYQLTEYIRTANTTLKMYRGAKLVDTFTYNNNQPATLALVINGLAGLAANSTNTAGKLAFDCCEILLYDTALSDSDRNNVERYLLDKWLAVYVTGTASGTSTVTGVGASLFLSTGTASGTSTVTGVGASLFLSTASGTGESTASGTGASLFAASGNGSGDSTAGATGASLFASSGNGSGDSTAGATGASLFAAVFGVACDSNCSGDTASLFSGVCSITGASTANAIGASTAETSFSCAGDSTAHADTAYILVHNTYNGNVSNERYINHHGISLFKQ